MIFTQPDRHLFAAPGKQIIKDSFGIMFYCGPAIDEYFLKFIGECLQWNFDYKQFDGCLKFKTNEQSTRGTVADGNKKTWAFKIAVPESGIKPKSSDFATSGSAW